MGEPEASLPHWPAGELTDADGPDRPAGRHAIDRAGLRKIEARKVKVWGQGAQRAYAIRNHARWLAAAHHDLKAEIEREQTQDKRASIGREDFTS